jgi:acyl-coenzyme A thioesterase PaaI-like protein
LSDDDQEYDRCYGCGQGNSRGLQMRFEHREGGAICRYTVADHLAGAPGVIHGGVQAALLDEVMGHAIHFAHPDPELDTVTVEFALRYRQPAPVAVPLEIRARLVRAEGRDFFVAGEIVSPAGDVFTTAEARWRRIRRS